MVEPRRLEAPAEVELLRIGDFEASADALLDPVAEVQVVLAAARRQLTEASSEAYRAVA